ncbi:ABC transporter substrate-binding protein [Providencia rettgeri]|uniref:ABC transporter substrate-binding protein n=1 Tax=Providencia TaxID=586 RepID=UPI00141A43C1|nr:MULTISPECIES: ABC transporter substrate-binding protein [Providencia]EJD6368067.1 ABC transporter substrate-binding protein [Providencia rettgeri]EJD6373324.1 ABC transporter substrate-binding protein [Providencia rettgeri]ELR5030393.1 ABC transporter substrate-binding protein [Providencia rettgeri]ELR5129967.1 ABC transporter substrate-binding protein [Providencia rettgeri]ELR5161127.1 ABC transporter substrate-binding protein [Providencia rettgeri]
MAINRRHFIKLSAVLATFYSLPSFAQTRYKVEQALFGKLPAPNNIQRVISSGPPSDLLLFALVPEKMVGFASISLKKGQTGFFAPQWFELPVYGRLAGRGSTLSLEQLLSYNPDLIIDTGNIDETYRSQGEKVAKQTNIPYLLISGGLQNSPQQLTQLGEILGAIPQAQKLSHLAQRYLDDAISFASKNRQKPLSFYLARGAKGLETGAKGSIHTEAIEMLGLHNVVDIPNFHGLTTVSMEQLYQWNPDIIITQYEEAIGFMTTSPLWKGLNAIKNNKLLIFSGMPFGWLDGPPGINRLLGMRRLQSHFDKNIAIHIKSDITKYFELFYHSSLTPEQVDLLIEKS